MNRKIFTGVAAALVAVSIPFSNAVIAHAENEEQTEQKEFSETDGEKAPLFNKERFAQNGEMPEFNGEMPPQFDGELPQFDGEMPESDGEIKPMRKGRGRGFNRKQSSEFNGEMPFGKPGRRMMPRKSDEDALAEGNPTPELPEVTEE
ncbi:MAG: hypothetical protein Q4C20_10095 [Erysipelotrichaceae bacterium]|nr:hypothetical protein [Erysipelotrichaceae bacterium]